MGVVVTGSAGFIGGHLVSTLRARGYDVAGIDRRPGTPREALWVAADLAATPLDAAVEGVLAGADAVFHLAGAPGVRACGDRVARRRVLDNVVAGERVLRLAARSSPVVVASSSSIYGGAGDVTSPRPCAESDRPRPLGGYAGSKVELERLCALRAAGGGMVAVARPFTVAGERQRPDMAIARWLAAARANRTLKIFGGLDRLRDITDVSDVVAGLIAIAERGLTGTVNLGSGIARTLEEIVGAVGEALAVEPRVAVEPAGLQEPPSTLADTGRMRRLLGITPNDDLIGLVARQARAAEPALVTS